MPWFLTALSAGTAPSTMAVSSTAPPASDSRSGSAPAPRRSMVMPPGKVKPLRELAQTPLACRADRGAPTMPLAVPMKAAVIRLNPPVELVGSVVQSQ